MMKRSRVLFAVAGLVLLAGGTASPARAVAEPEGCCCLGGPGHVTCTAMPEKPCLAKQQAAPQYDDKTKYDEALKKSEAEEAGKMKSGWREGKCPMAK